MPLSVIAEIFCDASLCSATVRITYSGMDRVVGQLRSNGWTMACTRDPKSGQAFYCPMHRPMAQGHAQRQVRGERQS